MAEPPPAALSREAFLQEVRSAFRAQGYAGDVVVDETKGMLVFPGV
jgi:hypothetical protein